MSDTPRIDRRPINPAPEHPPFHVILSYLLGAWADLRVPNPDRSSSDREPRS